MENASKALIMAAIILIGVLLLALMVYFFSSAVGLRSSYSDNVQTTRINEFNTKFTKYNITEQDYEQSEGEDYVTIHNIVSLANYAREFNQDLNANDSVYINIIVDGIGNLSNESNNLTEIIKEHMNEKYVSNGVVYGDAGRIQKMVFKQVKSTE